MFLTVCVVGSSPTGGAKNRQGSTESCRFYLLPINFSLFPKILVDFWEVIGNSEKGRSQGNFAFAKFIFMSASLLFWHLL